MNENRFGNCSIIKEVSIFIYLFSFITYTYIYCYIFVLKIQKAEDTIKTCYKKVKDLEGKLKTKDFPVEQRQSLQNELKEARKLLETNEKLLSELHGQNRKSFMVAACLFFVIFLVYGLYAMFGEKNLTY